jgi:hypothetical protein
MTDYTTPGRNPFATIEYLPSGDVLTTVITHTPGHIHLKMTRWQADLSASATVLYVTMPTKREDTDG